MDSYIVRQAIVNENEKTFGYEILYTDNSFGGAADDAAAANTIENFLSSMDTGKFLGGKTAFLTFTANLLEKSIPKMFATNTLVIQIEDSLITNPYAQNLITKYKQDGYKIAIKDFEFNPRFFGVLDIVDYIKVNFANSNDSTANIVNIGKSFNKKIIAYNIETQEAYENAKALGCTYYQGSFVAEKMPSSFKKVNYLQSNFFLLMVAVTKDEPDLDEIESIVSRDVSLTFSLLRLVNSAYFALRNRAKSVKQALVILGLGQLKQWIYLLSFKQDDGTMPDELVKISFLRATFASELIDNAKDMPISKSEAYLMGMFSTLGNLMQMPLEEVLEQLPIGDEVRDALLNQEGKAGTLYKLILSYEKADWKTMATCAEELGIQQSLIAQKYFECVESVNSTWESLTSVNTNIDEENA
ncbi:MAG: HDOD domain-containing protein [Oscillospiraceae bacterium]|nr:HDOD domain-containing protein [Oscillospiraceae bacterium]